jgi:hypothetical protein
VYVSANTPQVLNEAPSAQRPSSGAAA